jgi:polygalacturonase
LKSTIKNGIFHPCENIVVNNCTLESSSTALKIGTESHGNFNHIIFSNCVIRNSNRGISIVVRDGAIVENIFFTNLIIECNRKPFFWWGDADPIRFILLKRNPDSRLGVIRNVFVTNVVAKGQGTSLLQGFEGRPLENIVFDNVTLMLEPESLPDKRATDILQINSAKDVTLRNLTLGWNSTPTNGSKWNYAIRTNTLKHLTIQSLVLKEPIKKDRLLYFQNTTDLKIDKDFPKALIVTE